MDANIGSKIGGPELVELLTHGAWARRLACQLIREDEADDLLQEAWMSAQTGPGPSRAAPRAWLRGVMNIVARRRARAASRRRSLEARAAGDVSAVDESAFPDDLLARVETQRRLAEALLALDEPYRSTVLLRFYEGLSAAEIARRTEVPAGTVRWRLKEGLDRLRRGLDERAGGRSARALLLAPLVGRRPRPWTLSAMGLAASLGLLTLAGFHAVSRHHTAIAPQETPPAGQPDERSTRFRRAVGSLALAAAPRSPTITRPIPPSPVPRFWVPLGVGPLDGPSTAKVTILAFFDYQSPFCLTASRALDEVRRAHAGEVRYQVLHLPLPIHANAPLAARAALAANQQGKFWQMHEALLANQSALASGDLDRYAAEIGLDLDRFRADIIGPTVVNQAEIEEANARSLKVGGTPTLFFNGRGVAGSRTRAEYERIVTEELAYADAVLAAGVQPADLYDAVIRSGASEVAPGLDFDSPSAGQTVFHAAWELLGRNTALVDDCYRSTQPARPAGKLVLEVNLSPDQPPAFSIRDATIDAPGLGDCIVAALKTLTFPRPDGDRRIGLRRRFTFPPPPAPGRQGAP